ncbi:MAG TPA: hypothetical protein VL240_05910 [Candidatus Binatia bacterium]|nr:hypothetical protein [Candidatus Binatia bacterium]
MPPSFLSGSFRSIALLPLFFLVFPAFSSDAKQIAEAQALIDRAERVSSLTGPDAVPFFLQLRFDRTPSSLNGKGGTYTLWWSAHNKWRAQAESGQLREIELRNDQGLWLREDTDPRLNAIFSGARRFPFGGNLLAWNEKIVGLRERKLHGVKLSCVATEKLDVQRELCFDRQAGALIQDSSQVPVQSSYVVRQFEPMEFLTEYRDYTGVGDRIVPGEIRTSTNGQVTASIRLVSVALQPKAPFSPDMFVAGQGYRLWPGCDQYQAAKFNRNFWRQAPGVLQRDWFTSGGRVADGVRIVVGADGKPQSVELINPVGRPSKQVQSTFMSQTYEPAICDGKPVVGMLQMEFQQK